MDEMAIERILNRQSNEATQEEIELLCEAIRKGRMQVAPTAKAAKPKRPLPNVDLSKIKI